MGHVLRRCGSLAPTPDELQEAFLAWMTEPARLSGEPPTDSTVRSSFYAVSAWAEWRGVDLGEDPLEAFDVPPNPTNNGRGDSCVLQPGPAILFLEWLASRGILRDYAMARVFLFGGPRREELARLKVRHFFYEERRIHIPDEYAKRGVGGDIYLDRKTADAVRNYLLHRGDRGANPDAPLFHSFTTRDHLHPDSVTDLIGDLTGGCFGPAGRRTPHELRHTFQAWMENGAWGKPMPRPVVKVLMRHAKNSRDISERYSHPIGSIRDHYDAATATA